MNDAAPSLRKGTCTKDPWPRLAGFAVEGEQVPETDHRPVSFGWAACDE
jgi:hypothetical protein